MEEKEIIQVEVFNQIHHLSRQDFINFHHLTNATDFSDVKIPFKVLNDAKVHALNIILYYIIGVNKNFMPFPGDSLGNKYRALCTNEMSDYYIRNKFLIEEYEFAFLSSKVLGMKVQECAHIIYYLIYGRFASHPYINSLCSKNDYDYKRKVSKKGKDSNENLRSFKKRTINTEKSHSQFQLDSFRKDLKTVLKSQKNHALRRKDKNLGNDKIKQQLGQEGSVPATERTLNRGCSVNTFIPQRISQGQNSSIFENLSFQRKAYQTHTDWSKKELMRKQKFDEFFDINEFKLKTKLKRSPSAQQENKENNGRNAYMLNSDSQQIGKVNYESLRNISNGLKAKNATLDKIRGECSVRNYKFNFDKQNSQTLQDTLLKLAQSTKDSSNQFQLMHKRRKDNTGNKGLQISMQLKNNLTSTQSSENKNILLRRNFSFQSQQPFENVTRVQDYQGQKQDDYTMNILRNDDSHNQKFTEDNKMEYFAHSSTGFKKMNCKHKLQKYKSDYRKFMKTQLLDRIKQAN